MMGFFTLYSTPQCLLLSFKSIIMKKAILLTVFGLALSVVSAQNKVDENGLKQGVWKKTYPWGATRYEGAFEDDNEVGLFRFYDQNGKILSERKYETPGGVSNAVIYMPNGSVEAIGKFDGKKKIGEWKYFSTRGYLVSTDYYVDGLKEGPESFFYADSTLAEIVHWKAGEKNGEWNKYTEFSKTILKANFSNGQLHGAYISYYPSSEKKAEGTYKKGLKSGKWFYYSDKGVQEKMEVYEYGDLIKTVIRENDEIKTIQGR